MPKIECKCGNIIWLGEIPSPHQLLLISDIEFDKYWDNCEAEKLYAEMRIVVRCNNCGRLHIFWNGFNNPPEVYSKEQENLE